MTDVAIVGNGVIGLSIAERLLDRAPDAQITVIGPATRPGAASPAAGAMLGCFGEITKDTLASAPGRAKFEVCRRARGQWSDRFPDVHRVRGTHVVLNARSGGLDDLNFAAMLEALAEYDEPWEEVDPADVEGLRPVPQARPLRVVHLPREDAVDAHDVLAALERRISAAWCDATATEILVEGDGVRGVRTDVGVVEATRVVVASGAGAARLVAPLFPLGHVMPIFAGSGIAFAGRRVTGTPFTTVVRTPNRSGACGLHLVPLADGHEYVGATNILFAEPELSTYAGVSQFLIECAIDQFDQQIFMHRIREWRMGNRPVALDGFPLLGWTDVDGLYVAGGTYRDGLLCSPVLAEHAADELLGGSGTLDAPFDVHRRPLAVRSVDDAIGEFVLHAASGWFEAGARLPSFTATETLGEMLALRLRELHERLEIRIGLPPEVLMFLLDSHKDPRDVEAVGAYLRAIA